MKKNVCGLAGVLGLAVLTSMASATILMQTTFDTGTVQPVNGTSRYVFEDLAGAKMYPNVGDAANGGPTQLQTDTPFGVGKSYRATSPYGTEPTGSGGILRPEVNTMIVQNAYTIEAWIKPVNLSTGFSILRFNPFGGGSSNTIQLSVNASGAVVSGFYRTGNSWQTVTTDNGVVPTNTWTHVAAVYDRDNDHVSRVYVNGTQIKTLTVSSSYPSWDNVNFNASGNYNTLGQCVQSGTYGYIDDLLLANHGRTDAEIQYDSTHSFTVPEPAAIVMFLMGGLGLLRRRK